jgi:CheY-like chemotaxis protein/two-component sensor histidine kinase
MALERDRLFAELQLRNGALAEADRRKDQFLAMLGHELRNPLAPVLNAVRLLRDEEVPPATRRNALDAADRQVRHMARLVDDLLDVNRIRSGKVQLRKTELDLGKVVEAAVQSVETLFRSREHTLSLALPEEPIVIEGDPLRLTQVVMNLLANAAKYTDPGGHVTVRLERAGKDALLRIEDDGIGIPQELLPRVFELFVQGEQAVDRSRGGLGIGLALVKSLVEMHGGTAWAESDGPGKGSRFSVRLPAPPRALRPGLATPANGAVAAAQARWRILVVEDNEDIRVTLAELLRRRGHHVEEAEDGEDALAAAAAQAPDVALVDIGLPTVDGFVVARRLRELCPRTRLVAMTGYGSPDDRRRGVDAGFGAHLVKPVDIDELTALLSQLA